MFTPTLRCECAQPASDRLMRKWCILSTRIIGLHVFICNLNKLRQGRPRLAVLFIVCLFLLQPETLNQRQYE